MRFRPAVALAVPISLLLIAGCTSSVTWSPLESLTEGPATYKGRVVSVESRFGHTVIVGTNGQDYELADYDFTPTVDSYYKVFREGNALHAKVYFPEQEEQEKGKIATVGLENDVTVVTMESGAKYKLVGRPTLVVGQDVRIVKIELEYFAKPPK